MPRGPIGKLTEAAGLLYTPLPSEGVMAAAGLTAEDYAEEVEIWPENWRVVSLFAMLRTQWAVGMGGPTGLRYEAVYPLIDRQYGDPDEWDRAFDDIRVMEAAALRAMRDGK